MLETVLSLKLMYPTTNLSICYPLVWNIKMEAKTFYFYIWGKKQERNLNADLIHTKQYIYYYSQTQYS